MRFSVFQCSAVQGSAVHCSAVQSIALKDQDILHGLAVTAFISSLIITALQQLLVLLVQLNTVEYLEQSSSVQQSTGIVLTAV